MLQIKVGMLRNTEGELCMIPHHAVFCYLFHLKFLNLNSWGFIFPLAGQTFCFPNTSTFYKSGRSLLLWLNLSSGSFWWRCCLYFSCGVELHQKFDWLLCFVVFITAHRAFLKFLFGQRITGREQPTCFLFTMCWNKSSTCWTAPFPFPVQTGRQSKQVPMSSDMLSHYISQCRFPLISGLVSHTVGWMVIFIKCSDMYCWLPLISSDSSVTMRLHWSPYSDTYIYLSLGHSLPVLQILTY